MESGNHTPDNSQLEQLLQQQQDQDRKRKWMIPLGIAVALVGLLLNGGFGYTLIIIGLVAMGIGIALRSMAQDAIKDQVATPMIRQALEQVFTQVEYLPKGHISEGEIRGAGLGFSFEQVRGSDLIHATYRGVRLQLSDITLFSIQQNIDDDGNVQESEVVHFQGQWLICDFGRRLSADLRLTERSGLLDKLSKGTVQTENQAFNKRFRVDSSSPHEAFYILTPHMMEYILHMDDKAQAKTCMRFLQAGKLHVALQTGRDLFQVRQVKNLDLEVLSRQFQGEIYYVTELLDQLLRNETFFLKQ